MTRKRPRISKAEAGRVLADIFGALDGATTTTALASDVLGRQLAHRAGIAPAPAPAKEQPSPTRELLDRVERFNAHLDRERRRAEGEE